MGHDEHRRLAAAEERFERLPGGDIEVVRGLVEQQQVGGRDAQQGQLQPRPFATRELRHGLEHVLAPEQEPGEIRACRAVLDPRRRQDRIHDRGSRDGRVADLGQVAGLDVRTQAHEPVERRQHARDGAQERGLAGAVRPDDADAVAAGRLQARHAQDGHSLGCGRAPREADEHPFQRHRHVPGARRATAEQRLGRQRQLLLLPRCLRLRREQRIEPLLVLVHLGVLAVASIPLDELPLARDLLRRRVRVLALPRVGGLDAAGDTRSSRP